MRLALSISLALTCIAAPLSHGAALVDGFETWTDNVYGTTLENHAGVGGTWQSIGCITETSLQRTGSNAYRLTNGLVSGVNPYFDTAYKSGGVGEVSFWYRMDSASQGNYFVSYRASPGPFSNFPGGAGTIQNNNTTYSKWSYTFTNAPWDTTNIQIRIARNGTGPSMIVDDFSMGDFGGTNEPSTNIAPPEFLIDDFENDNLNAGLKGTAGQGTAPFIFISEKNEVLDLTYNQPDGNRDLAWWQALSFAWFPVAVTQYNYFRLDVRGQEGGEDFNVEFHYRDAGNNTQKPFVRLSDYGTITTAFKTINIPIEDFEDFDKAKAFAIALGFRHVTLGQDAVAIDNIGLSEYPTEFFQTHSAESVVSNAAEFLFKPHLPEGQGACGGVTFSYEVNSGTTFNVAMTSNVSVWDYTLSGLDNADSVTYRFVFDCPTTTTSKQHAFVHNSVIDLIKPSAPSFLFGVASSPSQVDLSWVAGTDNIGVAGYKVYRNDVEIGSTTNLGFSAQGLTQDTQYSFYVRTFDAAGNLSALSEQINVTTLTDGVAPSKPTNLMATVTGPSAVDLVWNASTDNVAVVGYEIFRDGSYIGAVASTSTVAGGIPGSNHSFTVRAFDDAGNLSAFSDAAAAVMPVDLVPPSIPGDPLAVAVSPFQINVSWPASTDNVEVAGYEIFRDGSLVGSSADPQFQALGLAETSTYSFAVRAFDGVGNVSGLSTTAVATTLSGSLSQLGSYAPAIPGGYPTPPSVIFITTNVTAPIPSTDWWSSMLQVRCSGMMAARPLNFYAKGWALECAYPNARSDGNNNFISSFFANEIAFTATGGSFGGQPNGEARVDGYGDFSVRARIGNDASHITATMVHGSPFAYMEYENCDPLITCKSGYTAVETNTSVSYLLVRTTGAQTNHFAIFAPSGTTWDTASATVITPTLPPGEHFMSVAVLSSQSVSYDTGELTLLRNHAYAFVTNTVADFTYDRPNGMIRSTFTAQTKTMQDGQAGTLMGLLPHHWKHTADPVVAGMDYRTLLGDIKIVDGNSFMTDLRFHGIVPQFPEPTDPSWDRTTFEVLADQIQSVDLGKNDTYWHGKDLARLARVIPALDASRLTSQRDLLLGYLKASLSNMFTYVVGEPNQFFAYDSQWGALFGFNESFGSVQLMSDNHFHYGMFVYSAAIAGFYDPFFAASYKDVVDKVIRQFNNPSKDTSGPDPLPWLRCFDPWEGHCWATGLGGAPQQAPVDEILFTGERPVASYDGPDQESTGESMSAWAAMFLWGLATGDDEFLDMGAIGYTIEAEAVREYWYDADGSNHRPGYNKTMISRLFGNKLDPWTWFSAEMDDAWGIQYMLAGPHMTYMGHYPEYRLTDYGFFKTNFPGGTAAIDQGWKDIHWMYRSFFEPVEVLSEYNSTTPVNDGNTKANLYYWVHVMNSLGQLDTNVYSDHPSLVAFVAGNATNFVGFNFSGNLVTARVYRASDDALIGEILLTNQKETNFSTDGDDDADGLDNAEEMTAGTDIFDADTDDDEQNDWAEVFTGVDPRDATSVFDVRIATINTDGVAQVTWPGNAARTYQVNAYPSIPDAASGTNASNLLMGVSSGQSVVTQTVTIPAWQSGLLRVIAE